MELPHRSDVMKSDRRVLIAAAYRLQNADCDDFETDHKLDKAWWGILAFLKDPGLHVWGDCDKLFSIKTSCMEK